MITEKQPDRQEASGAAPSRALKRSPKRSRLPLWITAILMVIIIVFAIVRMKPQSQTGKMILGTVQKGDLIETVTATGSVNAQTGAEVHIGSQITGQIKRLNADIGQHVKAGQVIAELNLPDLEANVANARAALSAAQMRYSQELNGVNLTTTTTSSGITQAQQGYESARQKLAVAMANLKQQSEQTPSDVEKARTAQAAAQAGLSSAQSNLSVVKFNSNLSVVNAREAVAQAQAQANLSAVTERRERNLVTQGFAAKADLDTAVAQSQVNASQVRAAQQNLNLTTQRVALDIKTAQDQLTQAQQNLLAAKAGLRAAQAEQYLVTARTADVTDARTAIQQADAAMRLANAGTANNTIKAENVRVMRDAVTQAQATLAFNSAQLDKSFIRSPIAGTVLNLAVQQGETLAAGLSAPTVIVVADLNRLQVDAFVDETDIGKVKLGQPAKVSADAYPNHTFEGKVVKVASGSTIQQGVVTYDVTVFIKQDKRFVLKPDMTANVNIQTGTRTGVLLVPAVAVQLGTRGSTVNVVQMKDGKQEIVPVKVKTGGTDGVNVEIRSGLKEGDKIVLAGMAQGAGGNRGPSNPFGPAPRAGAGGGGGGGGR